MPDHTAQQQRHLPYELAVQPSTRGAVYGGILGAVTGAIVGLLRGGALAAVRSSFVGLIGGVIAGDALTTRRRRLTPAEIEYADEIFDGCLNYEPIRVLRDSMFSSGAPITLGNTVCLKTEWDHFEGDGMELTEQGRRLLIHELVHVWQYQTAGPAYFSKSLWAQFKAWCGEGSRNGAYRWRDAHDSGRPWQQWNPEQQASVVEACNVLLRHVREGSASDEDQALLTALRPYIEKLHKGEGAPRWEFDRLLTRIGRSRPRASRQ